MEESRLKRAQEGEQDELHSENSWMFFVVGELNWHSFSHLSHAKAASHVVMHCS